MAKGTDVVLQLRDFCGFRGSAEELAETAGTVLASVGQSAPVSCRVIRDYVWRGLLGRPERERTRREAFYGYEHLVRLVAIRILLGDGWPRAKVGDYMSSATIDELVALAQPRGDGLASDVARRSARSTGRGRRGAAENTPAPSGRGITDRQAKLATLRTELPVHMSRIVDANEGPIFTDYTAVSLAVDLHLMIAKVRLSEMTLDEAEAIGRAVTASLMAPRARGGRA